VNNWNWTTIVVTTGVVLALFGYLWWQGQIQRLAVYVQETREELRKCSWPSWDELKGSTLLVAATVAFLGVFVYVIDQVLFHVFIR
jgi:preprotein translocase subunit SecE